MTSHVDTASKTSNEVPVKPLRHGTLCSTRIREPYYTAMTLQPKLVDDFCLNRQREITIGNQNHKYLVEKYLDDAEYFSFDLNDGFLTYDPKPGDEGIHTILQYIQKKAKPGESMKQVIHGADFVCFRGYLTKIAASPYEEGGIGWKFAITKFNDTFFLMELDTDARIADRANETPKTKMFTYWGHKFETYIFAKEGEEPNTAVPVSTWEEMGSLFYSEFPKNGDKEPEVKVFYSAEMDGLDKNGKHVEAKTQFKDLFIGRFFDQKAMKWWLQSYFVGIEDLVIGFRTDSGIVNRVKKVNLEFLRQRCKKWNSSILLRTTQHVLNQIRHFYNQQIKNGEMLIVERKPDCATIQYEVVPEGSYAILTEDFKQQFATKEESMLRKRESNVEDSAEAPAKKAVM